MEKKHLKFCYIYITNASITQNMRFLNINEFILETFHGKIDHFSTWKCQQLKIPPEIRPATALKLSFYINVLVDVINNVSNNLNRECALHNYSDRWRLRSRLPVH